MLKTAEQELGQGVLQMLGKTLRSAVTAPVRGAIILGTLTDLHELSPTLHPPQELNADGYWLKSTNIQGSKCLLITAATDRGVLYGVFGLLRKIALAESVSAIDEVQQPYAPIRWVNQWDNLDGRIDAGTADLPYSSPMERFAAI